MRPAFRAPLAGAFLLFAFTLLSFSGAALATDVDGPDDCQRPAMDFGDAPEGIDAYPGVTGHFPTCGVSSHPATWDTTCTPISSKPLFVGFVLHDNPVASYWLGCGSLSAAMGIDGDPDGKTSVGSPSSRCSGEPVDCSENAFGLDFGQDECWGSDDAGVHRPTLEVCQDATVTFDTYNCGSARDVYLNILIDMNRDGDWNDNFLCPSGCTYEWAVKNALVTLPTGCNTQASPAFRVGPFPGEGWMRVSITDVPVNDDFPWYGSRSMGVLLPGGETEDYPVQITAVAGAREQPSPEHLRLAVEPNPARIGTTVRFTLPERAYVELGIHDIAGRLIRSLAGRDMAAGVHTLGWDFRSTDGRDVGPGVYLVKLVAGQRTVSATAIRIP